MSPPSFTICVFHPRGFTHMHAVDEMAETLRFGIEALGYPARVTRNELGASGINVLFCAHVMDQTSIDLLPPDTIIFNTEQMDAKSVFLAQGYGRTLGRFRVWDYSRANIRRLAGFMPGARVSHVGLGYAPSLSHIPPAPQQDIDVLFYGSMNERRRRIIQGLAGAGLKVANVFNVYGAARDELIARAKVVLNLHFYDVGIFEIARVSYLLANRKAVVSEWGEDLEDYAPLRQGVRFAAYDELVEACAELARDEALRRRYEEAGHDAFARLPAADFMRAAVAEAVAEYAASKPASRLLPLPKTVNLGSGRDWRADCLNIDVDAAQEPDLEIDLCRPPPFGAPLETRRFGQIRLAPGMFDRILANDVLEHVGDLAGCMTNCLALLREGGEMHIRVPYDLSLGAWQDPTHRRAFNENSWLYYTDWHWYLGWDEARFDLVETKIVLSAFGKSLHQGMTPDEALMRAPRAVDALLVKLRKRRLTKQEVARGVSARTGGARLAIR